MKVSIVIPTHNRAYIIGDAIASVLAQTFQDWELLIVDDGSTDNTSELVAAFADRRIRYLPQPVNRGCAAAYNTGVANASGEFTSFLDSDDLWKPGKLETELAFLARHSEVGAVFGDLEKEDGGEHTASFMRSTGVFSRRLPAARQLHDVVLGNREMYLLLLHEVPVKLTAFTARTSALRETGFFDEAQPSANDWEFFLRFSTRYQLGYMDEPLAVLRCQSDATHRIHWERNFVYVLEFLRREWARNAADPEARAAAMAGIIANWKQLAWHYAKFGLRRECIGAFWKGFRETKDFGLFTRAVLYAASSRRVGRAQPRPSVSPAHVVRAR